MSEFRARIKITDEITACKRALKLKLCCTKAGHRVILSFIYQGWFTRYHGWSTRHLTAKLPHGQTSLSLKNNASLVLRCAVKEPRVINRKASGLETQRNVEGGGLGVEMGEGGRFLKVRPPAPPPPSYFPLTARMCGVYFASLNNPTCYYCLPHHQQPPTLWTP